MIKVLRVENTDERFLELVGMLNEELKSKDGSDHAFYNQFNGTEGLDYVVIVELDNRSVGCGAIKKFDESTHEVKRMYTLPELRGKGIAARSLRELETIAAENNIGRLVLETGIRQPEAIALYQKHGYEQIPNYGPYKEVENSICFEKNL